MAINICFNNYRSHINNLFIEKLLPVERDFLLPCHDFERDAVYKLIEKNRKDSTRWCKNSTWKTRKYLDDTFKNHLPKRIE